MDNSDSHYKLKPILDDMASGERMPGVRALTITSHRSCCYEGSWILPDTHASCTAVGLCMNLTPFAVGLRSVSKTACPKVLLQRARLGEIATAQAFYRSGMDTDTLRVLVGLLRRRALRRSPRQPQMHSPHPHQAPTQLDQRTSPSVVHRSSAPLASRPHA